MSRFNYDSDEERLPEHFIRVGYDADTERYTFEDTSTGRLYESAPGQRYGVLTPVGARQNEGPDPEEIEAHNVYIRKSNKEAARLMLPFALLVLVALLLLFKFLYGGAEADGDRQIHCAQGATALQVKGGDTCWAIGKAHGLDVEELLALQGNEGIDCDGLPVGQEICVPR